MNIESESKENVERLIGVIEHITFHNEANGFCVLRIRAKRQRELITVIGNAASLSKGEEIEGIGEWIRDKKYGLQFKTTQLKITAPASLEGIEKYLASGMVKGIGPHFAKKLVKAFGAAVFEVIENDPLRLTELEGIGEKRKLQVITAWAEQKSIRDIMVFLQSYGIGAARAVRIYKTYGDHAIAKVSENPYRLALDIQGIGFKIADALAQRLGVARDSILRAQAGVRYVLQTLCNYGHCAAPYDRLIEASISLLEISQPIIEEAITVEIETKNLILENIHEVPCLFPCSLYQAESTAARHLLRIYGNVLPWEKIDIAQSIPWVEKKTALTLSTSQKNAVATLLQTKLSILTGGPGVGKTTIINSVLKILQSKGLSVALCAPTGRAAKRLTETTGLAAKTIHRLLAFDPKTFSFKHHQENPLPNDVFIIDESSMIDIVLFSHLLKSIPTHAAVIFAGDVDQLPSVGPGAVLLDMIRSGVITTVRLTEIFRQAANSKIIMNAHLINEGNMPLLNQGGEVSDFYTIYTETPDQIYDQLMSLVTERLPQHYHCDPIKEIQVLSPMKRGQLGSSNLNMALQKKLNGLSEPTVARYGMTFAPGDKVIQTINNYGKEIFNGDIGFISQVNLETSSLNVSFDHRTVTYDFNELDEINLAYTISIHKSQGSEFPIVVIPLSTQHYPLLARNLLYTGVTRGKKLVVLVGQKRAVVIAVKNNKENQRLTNLAARVRFK